MRIKIHNDITDETFEYQLNSFIFAYRIHDREVDKVLAEYKDKESFHMIYHIAETVMRILKEKAFKDTESELTIRKIAGQLESIRLNDDMEKSKFLCIYQPKEQMYDIDFYEEEQGEWLNIFSVSSDFVLLIGVNETLQGGYSPVTFIEPLSNINDLAFSSVFLTGVLANMKDAVMDILDKQLITERTNSADKVLENL